MILVAGIHGVGKSSYCQTLKSKLDIPIISASETIYSYLHEFSPQNKQVENIDDNQHVLIRALRSKNLIGSDCILDGHLCLVNNEGQIEPIDKAVFQQLSPKEIIVLTAPVAVIADRLHKRNQISWDEDFIDKFQKMEIEYGKQIGKLLKVSVTIIDEESFSHEE